MPEPGQQRVRHHLELLIGLFGFFSVIAFVAAVAELLRDDPGVGPALVLAAFLLATALAVRARARR
ncbi:hypothetical protein DW322_05715 [Rhodococcus rhodnii]|uniref:Uncharacterized protein n=2 Tax=Rhodococcus rhodnii TaxID=38312 RepID=R7WNE1_9NOCA|nr:hypothetical protein [Rhodococcus rhodnii]EOM76817.1 hypothetical protein Rrhod_1730 [Rhodococcus rhodnii LMG 5362]TXG89801.1 hypothetical protein DW322_05715 [Rhodococcus rhodnii]